MRICTLYDTEKMNIPDPIERRTLLIGDFAAQIENDTRGLISGTMIEGDQRETLHLVVGSEFFWVFRGKNKNCGGFFVVTFCAYLLNMCNSPRYFAR